jgi:hypothetical protein
MGSTSTLEDQKFTCVSTEATATAAGHGWEGRCHGFPPMSLGVLHEYASNSSCKTLFEVQTKLCRRGELVAGTRCGVRGRAGGERPLPAAFSC